MMWLFRKTIIIVWMVIMILLGSCSKREPEYSGIRLSQWVAMLDAPDPVERADALQALAKMGKSAKITEMKIRDIARRDPDLKVRLEAINTLKALELPITEFEEFYKEMTTPLFFEESDTLAPGIGEEAFPESEQETSGANLPGDSDLFNISPDTDTAKIAIESFPQDTTRLEIWRRAKRAEEVDNLLIQLQNPLVLAEILRVGEMEEKRLAAKKLAQMSGSDALVVEALEAALSDPDTVVRSAVKEALSRWSRPY
ncbi:MAG: hypothetical protein ACK4OO_03065 [bacterium]